MYNLITNIEAIVFNEKYLLIKNVKLFCIFRIIGDLLLTK